MDLTSKQRAHLKSLSNNIDSIFQIGKSSFSPELAKSVSEALEKRELIKVSVLKNCMDDPKELAQLVSERTHSTIVQVIGKKIILYRPSKKDPKIVLPNPGRKSNGKAKAGIR